MRVLPGILARDPEVEDPDDPEDPEDPDDPDDPGPPDEPDGPEPDPFVPVGIFASFRGQQGVDTFPHNLNFPAPEPAHTRQNVTTAPFVAPGSTQSFSIEIRPNDPKATIDVQQAPGNPKRRAEFSWRGGASDFPRYAAGAIGWMGAHFYLPTDPMAAVKGCDFFQLHNNPDPGVTCHLFLFGGRLRAAISPQTSAEIELLNVPVAPFLDRWNRLVIDFRPSTSGTGFIKLWINDVQLIDHVGKNRNSGSQGPFLKNGTYFWGHENFDSVRRAKVFYDHIRCGNATSNFQSVNPITPFP